MKFAKSAKLQGKITKKVSFELDMKQIKPNTPSEFLVADILQHVMAFERTLDNEKEIPCLMCESAAGTFEVERIVPTDGELIRIEGRGPDGSRIWRLINAQVFAFALVAKPRPTKEDDDQQTIGFVLFDELRAREPQKYTGSKARYSKKATAAKGKASKPKAKAKVTPKRKTKSSSAKASK